MIIIIPTQTSRLGGLGVIGDPADLAKIYFNNLDLILIISGSDPLLYLIYCVVAGNICWYSVLYLLIMSARKNTGGPDGKYYESSETISKMENVKQWLLRNCKKVPLEGVNWNIYHKYSVHVYIHVYIVLYSSPKLIPQTISYWLTWPARCYSFKRYNKSVIVHVDLLITRWIK